MRVTIKEVAHAAGVSIATVSRVLNDSGPVTEATRLKVKHAVQALNYQPHSAARSLITSKTHTVGIVLPVLYGEFFSEVLRGIDQAARPDGYQLLVSSSHASAQELEASLHTMAGKVDGLIVMLPDIEADALAAILPGRLPLVLLNCHVNGVTADALISDNHQGAYQMVRHLQHHGHEQIAIIKGLDGHYEAEERLAGYRAALREAGQPTDGTLEFPGDFTEASGYMAVKRILEMAPRPTALFAANDAMAIGALRALREAGLRVPDHMAVAGFDDIPIARYVNPTLSTVHVAISDMGAEAVAMLIRAIEDEDHQPVQRRQPTRLAIRESCGGHLDEP